jgi:hypothetical protein
VVDDIAALQKIVRNADRFASFHARAFAWAQARTPRTPCAILGLSAFIHKRVSERGAVELSGTLTAVADGGGS